MDIPILRSERRWECPNCPAQDVTFEAQPHTRFHDCAGLRGMSAPFVPAGMKCKVEAKEREDYIGSDVVTRDGEGRPVMAIETTRDDGNDVVVFAPCATAEGSVR